MDKLYKFIKNKYESRDNLTILDNIIFIKIIIDKIYNNSNYEDNFFDSLLKYFGGNFNVNFGVKLDKLILHFAGNLPHYFDSKMLDLNINEGGSSKKLKLYVGKNMKGGDSSNVGTYLHFAPICKIILDDNNVYPAIYVDNIVSANMKVDINDIYFYVDRDTLEGSSKIWVPSNFNSYDSTQVLLSQAISKYLDDKQYNGDEIYTTVDFRLISDPTERNRVLINLIKNQNIEYYNF